MAIVKHLTIEIPITITVEKEADLGWACQHLDHQIKRLLRQKKWTKETRFGIKYLSQVRSIQFVPRKP